jgi:hypothetical protein
MKAFPSSEPIHGNDVIGIKQSYGMELRDYFAAKAMQAIITNETVHSEILKISKAMQADSENTIAKCSYNLADAMMEIRK